MSTSSLKKFKDLKKALLGAVDISQSKILQQVVALNALRTQLSDIIASQNQSKFAITLEKYDPSSTDLNHLQKFFQLYNQDLHKVRQKQMTAQKFESDVQAFLSQKESQQMFFQHFLFEVETCYRELKQLLIVEHLPAIPTFSNSNIQQLQPTSTAKVDLQILNEKVCQFRDSVGYLNVLSQVYDEIFLARGYNDEWLMCCIKGMAMYRVWEYVKKENPSNNANIIEIQKAIKTFHDQILIGLKHYEDFKHMADLTKSLFTVKTPIPNSQKAEELWTEIQTLMLQISQFFQSAQDVEEVYDYYADFKYHVIQWTNLDLNFNLQAPTLSKHLNLEIWKEFRDHFTIQAKSLCLFSNFSIIQNNGTSNWNNSNASLRFATLQNDAKRQSKDWMATQMIPMLTTVKQNFETFAKSHSPKNCNQIPEPQQFLCLLENYAKTGAGLQSLKVNNEWKKVNLQEQTYLHGQIVNLPAKLASQTMDPGFKKIIDDLKAFIHSSITSSSQPSLFQESGHTFAVHYDQQYLTQITDKTAIEQLLQTINSTSTLTFDDFQEVVKFSFHCQVYQTVTPLLEKLVDHIKAHSNRTRVNDAFDQLTSKQKVVSEIIQLCKYETPTGMDFSTFITFLQNFAPNEQKTQKVKDWLIEYEKALKVVMMANSPVSVTLQTSDLDKLRSFLVLTSYDNSKPDVLLNKQTQVSQHVKTILQNALKFATEKCMIAGIDPPVSMTPDCTPDKNSASPNVDLEEIIRIMTQVFSEDIFETSTEKYLWEVLRQDEYHKYFTKLSSPQQTTVPNCSTLSAPLKQACELAKHITVLQQLQKTHAPITVDDFTDTTLQTHYLELISFFTAKHQPPDLQLTTYEVLPNAKQQVLHAYNDVPNAAEITTLEKVITDNQTKMQQLFPDHKVVEIVNKLYTGEYLLLSLSNPWDKLQTGAIECLRAKSCEAFVFEGISKELTPKYADVVKFVLHNQSQHTFRYDEVWRALNNLRDEILRKADVPDLATYETYLEHYVAGLVASIKLIKICNNNLSLYKPDFVQKVEWYVLKKPTYQNQPSSPNTDLKEVWQKFLDLAMCIEYDILKTGVDNKNFIDVNNRLQMLTRPTTPLDVTQQCRELLSLIDNILKNHSEFFMCAARDEILKKVLKCDDFNSMVQTFQSITLQGKTKIEECFEKLYTQQQWPSIDPNWKDYYNDLASFAKTRSQRVRELFQNPDESKRLAKEDEAQYDLVQQKFHSSMEPLEQALHKLETEVMKETNLTLEKKTKVENDKERLLALSRKVSAHYEFPEKLPTLSFNDAGSQQLVSNVEQRLLHISPDMIQDAVNDEYALSENITQIMMKDTFIEIIEDFLHQAKNFCIHEIRIFVRLSSLINLNLITNPNLEAKKLQSFIDKWDSYKTIVKQVLSIYPDSLDTSKHSNWIKMVIVPLFTALQEISLFMHQLTDDKALPITTKMIQNVSKALQIYESKWTELRLAVSRKTKIDVFNIDKNVTDASTQAVLARNRIPETDEVTNKTINLLSAFFELFQKHIDFEYTLPTDKKLFGHRYKKLEKTFRCCKSNVIPDLEKVLKAIFVPDPNLVTTNFVDIVALKWFYIPIYLHDLATKVLPKLVQQVPTVVNDCANLTSPELEKCKIRNHPTGIQDIQALVTHTEQVSKAKCQRDLADIDGNVSEKENFQRSVFVWINNMPAINVRNRAWHQKLVTYYQKQIQKLDFAPLQDIPHFDFQKHISDALFSQDQGKLDDHKQKAMNSYNLLRLDDPTKNSNLKNEVKLYFKQVLAWVDFKTAWDKCHYNDFIAILIDMVYESEVNQAVLLNLLNNVSNTFDALQPCETLLELYSNMTQILVPTYPSINVKQWYEGYIHAVSVLAICSHNQIKLDDSSELESFFFDFTESSPLFLYTDTLQQQLQNLFEQNLSGTLRNALTSNVFHPDCVNLLRQSTKPTTQSADFLSTAEYLCDQMINSRPDEYVWKELSITKAVKLLTDIMNPTPTATPASPPASPPATPPQLTKWELILSQVPNRPVIPDDEFPFYDAYLQLKYELYLLLNELTQNPNADDSQYLQHKSNFEQLTPPSSYPNLQNYLAEFWNIAAQNINFDSDLIPSVEVIPVLNIPAFTWSYSLTNLTDVLTELKNYSIDMLESKLNNILIPYCENLARSQVVTFLANTIKDVIRPTLIVNLFKGFALYNTMYNSAQPIDETHVNQYIWFEKEIRKLINEQRKFAADYHTQVVAQLNDLYEYFYRLINILNDAFHIVTTQNSTFDEAEFKKVFEETQIMVLWIQQWFLDKTSVTLFAVNEQTDLLQFAATNRPPYDLQNKLEPDYCLSALLNWIETHAQYSQAENQDDDVKFYKTTFTTYTANYQANLEDALYYIQHIHDDNEAVTKYNVYVHIIQEILSICMIGDRVMEQAKTFLQQKTQSVVTPDCITKQPPQKELCILEKDLVGTARLLRKLMQEEAVAAAKNRALAAQVAQNLQEESHQVQQIQMLEGQIPTVDVTIENAHTDLKKYVESKVSSRTLDPNPFAPPDISFLPVTYTPQSVNNVYAEFQNFMNAKQSLPSIHEVEEILRNFETQLTITGIFLQLGKLHGFAEICFKSLHGVHNRRRIAERILRSTEAMVQIYIKSMFSTAILQKEIKDSQTFDIITSHAQFKSPSQNEIDILKNWTQAILMARNLLDMCETETYTFEMLTKIESILLTSHHVVQSIKIDKLTNCLGGVLRSCVDKMISSGISITSDEIQEALKYTACSMTDFEKEFNHVKQQCKEQALNQVIEKYGLTEMRETIEKLRAKLSTQTQIPELKQQLGEMCNRYPQWAQEKKAQVLYERQTNSLQNKMVVADNQTKQQLQNELSTLLNSPPASVQPQQDADAIFGALDQAIQDEAKNQAERAIVTTLQTLPDSKNTEWRVAMESILQEYHPNKSDEQEIESLVNELKKRPPLHFPVFQTFVQENVYAHLVEEWKSKKQDLHKALTQEKMQQLLDKMRAENMPQFYTQVQQTTSQVLTDVQNTTFLVQSKHTLNDDQVKKWLENMKNIAVALQILENRSTLNLSVNLNQLKDLQNILQNFSPKISASSVQRKVLEKKIEGFIWTTNYLLFNAGLSGDQTSLSLFASNVEAKNAKNADLTSYISQLQRQGEHEVLQIFSKLFNELRSRITTLLKKHTKPNNFLNTTEGAITPQELIAGLMSFSSLF